MTEHKDIETTRLSSLGGSNVQYLNTIVCIYITMILAQKIKNEDKGRNNEGRIMHKINRMIHAIYPHVYYYPIVGTYVGS